MKGRINMKVNQIARILNDLNDAMVGADVTFADDLSNIVDAGKSVLDFTGKNKDNYENYIGKLIDRVGKVIFVDREYRSQAPNILKDSWEYASIMMKVRVEMMDNQDNATWQLGEIPNGTGLSNDQDAQGNPIVPSRLDPFVLNKPNANAKFYNKRVAYEIQITLADYQLRSAMASAAEMARFIATIENRIRVKKTLDMDALIMATIRNLAGNKIVKGKAINLLPLYNQTLAAGTEITAADYWTNPDAIRFANKTIALYKKYMAAASTLYNEGDYVTYTPEDRLKAVFLSEYVKDAEAYLYSDTFHKEFVELSGYDEVGYWEGSSTDDTLESRSTIKGTFVDNDEKKFTGGIDGVIAALFDEEAAAVVCEHDRVTSQRNGRAEYVNYFYKYDCGVINDLEENCVIFYISDDTVAGTLPAAAPATWASAYAIASSPYYVWDSETEAYTQLTTDDVITDANPWTNYAYKAYLYKPTT